MKLAIVTGGSRGLGKALVEAFSRDQWEVVDFSRSGKGPYHQSFDLRHTNEVESKSKALFSRISRQKYEHVVLINNAATITPIKRVSDITKSQFQHSITVNIVSSLCLMQLFIQKLRTLDTRKTLINISSGAANKGYAGWSLYCAGKASCDNFIRAIAEEERTESFPFEAFNFNPDVMDTAMQAEIRESDSHDFPSIERFQGYKLNNELRSPSEVAHVLVQLIKHNNVLTEDYYSV